jgi:predicted ATPase
MILTLAVSGYRSIRNLILPLERLNVITGGNGAGKSSLYRALRLLADVAQDGRSPRWPRRAACNRRCGRGPRSFPRP